MSIVRPPEFLMGSPASEPRRELAETQHRVRIPREYAIATKEVSVAEFARFLASDAGLKRQFEAGLVERFRSVDGLRIRMPEPQCPQVGVTWYDAARFCNWLTASEGMPERELVYPREIGPGMKLPPDYLTRKGYRLPTEAEWELAARGGTAGSHFFGEGDALVRHYAWFQDNTELHTHPGGRLKPNPFGLFDVYGNAWEWLQSRRRDYPAPPGAPIVDAEERELEIRDDVALTRRGGSYSYGLETTRSAHRGATNYFPNQRRDSVGFRVARTLSAVP
jgi:formylglycine-generating enzyme required for sulfatase activity